MAKKNEIPEGYAIYKDAHQILNVPVTTLPRHVDPKNISVYYVNDEIVIKLDEAIAVLTSTKITRRITRMRVMAGLKESETASTKIVLFAQGGAPWVRQNAAIKIHIALDWADNPININGKQK